MTSTPDQAPTAADVRAFGETFRRFLEWINSGSQQGNEVVELVRRVLGADGSAESVVRRDLPSFEHVNVQTAFDAWSTAEGRAVVLHGVAMPPHWPGLSIQHLISGDMLPPLRLTAPALIEQPNGPGSSLGCLQLALAEVTDDRGTYLLLVRGPHEHERGMALEVAGLPRADAQSVLAELDELRSRLNVYRGQVLYVQIDDSGNVSLPFGDLPSIDRSSVVLPPTVIDRVERHALGVAQHRQALLRAGQHLKRGLLLYGPPGTGKTHTAKYLMGRMRGYTRLILTGRCLHVVGSVTDLARALQPSVVVLEDVDLVAEDRSFTDSPTPVLYDLLDAMDGAAPDADLLFLLTTNRADLLEPALAARPGRVDVAVEIGRPDADARRRLLELYGAGARLQLDADDLDRLVERTAGVTASFVKELVRRAVLEALDAGRGTAVTPADLDRALADLLDTTQQLTRTLLGAESDERPLLSDA